MLHHLIYEMLVGLAHFGLPVALGEEVVTASTKIRQMECHQAGPRSDFRGL